MDSEPTTTTNGESSHSAAQSGNQNDETKKGKGKATNSKRLGGGMDSDRAKIARANRYKAKFHALREKYDSVNATNEGYKREIALAKVKLRKLEDENDLLVDQIAMDIDYQPEISAHLYPQTPELQYSTVIALDRLPIRPPPLSRNHSYDQRDFGHPPPPPSGPPAQLAERQSRDRSGRRPHQHTASTTNGRGGSGKGHRQNGNGAVPPPPPLTTNGSSGVIEPKTEPEPSVIPSPPEVEEEPGP